jgi:hypothetical protein
MKAQHEEIARYKAAMKIFDNFGLKKLLEVKKLSEECVAILAKKKKLNALYSPVKKEMMEYQIAMKNIDCFLKLYAETPERER